MKGKQPMIPYDNKMLLLKRCRSGKGENSGVVARAKAILWENLLYRSYPQSMPGIMLTGARDIGLRPFVEIRAFVEN